MSPTLILQAVLAYGPSVLPLIQQIVVWIQGGKTDVTPADIQQLIDYGNKTSAQYFAAVGVTPPSAPVAPMPPATPVAVPGAH
jgi:hypothetical protein